MVFGRLFNIKSTIVVVFVIMSICSCKRHENFNKTMTISDSTFKGTVTIERVEKLKRYRLSIHNSLTGGTDRIYTPYDVFQMELGDVNRDGKTDICLGIIKPTPFDPTMKKRLFIFQIDRDYIRPLWLSSRLVHPLEKFSIYLTDSGEYHIKSIEVVNKDLYCISEYRWGSFGMVYTGMVNDSLSYSEALNLLEN